MYSTNMLYDGLWIKMDQTAFSVLVPHRRETVIASAAAESVLCSQ